MNSRNLLAIASTVALACTVNAYAQGTGPAPYGQQSATPASSTSPPSHGKASGKHAKGKGAQGASAPRANAAEDTGAMHSN